METLFYPKSIVIIGLSSKENNIPRLILENLLRWGYMGRILGVNPSGKDEHVDGIKMYLSIADLPIVPDIAVALVPAKYVPDTIEQCGIKGIKRMAIPSGGFNELGKEGIKLAKLVQSKAQEHGIKFVGPNGVTIANTANGLCLPFVPSYMPMKGGLSIVTQSGGVGLMLWNLMANEDIGMAKFASIGNKLNLDEVDFLEYFGRDIETKIICMYLESISRGKEFLETARKIKKPVVVLKANTTPAGKKAAMSHTAALSNDDRILDEAFKSAGVIRVHTFSDFMSVAKAFRLPPMKGNRVMIMSPAGGFTVMVADLCEKLGFEFADPGEKFYASLTKYSNAGVINFTNPLDMGDIYDPRMHANIFYSVLHNENVDGAVYVSQWPRMPKGSDAFTKMFNTDLSNETIGAIQSSGKPLCVTLFGPYNTTTRIKQNLSMPIFNTPEEMVLALKIQKDFHAYHAKPSRSSSSPENMLPADIKTWIQSRRGDIGEEAMELLDLAGIPRPTTLKAESSDEAVNAAQKLSYPVVMKVISADALHKSEAGGVITNITDDESAAEAFDRIRANLLKWKEEARFEGVRVIHQADFGHDMFIGGIKDPSFGPVVFFGMGGIYVELYSDAQCSLCPVSHEEVTQKLKTIKSWPLLEGYRGSALADVDAFIDAVVRVSWMMSLCNEIQELDINPIRIFEKGSGTQALDIRMRIEG